MAKRGGQARDKTPQRVNLKAAAIAFWISVPASLLAVAVGFGFWLVGMQAWLQDPWQNESFSDSLGDVTISGNRSFPKPTPTFDLLAVVFLAVAIVCVNRYARNMPIRWTPTGWTCTAALAGLCVLAGGILMTGAFSSTQRQALIAGREATSETRPAAPDDAPVSPDTALAALLLAAAGAVFIVYVVHGHMYLRRRDADTSPQAAHIQHLGFAATRCHSSTGSSAGSIEFTRTSSPVFACSNSARGNAAPSGVVDHLRTEGQNDRPE